MRHRVLTAIAALLFAACGNEAHTVPSTNPPIPRSPSIRPSASAPAPITADALAGRDFVSTSLTGRDLAPRTRVGLRFWVGGRLTGGAGCNLMDGTWALDGTTLDAQYAATTEMGCAAARHAQDIWVGEFISSRPSVSIDGDELVLVGDGLTMTLLDLEVADPDRPVVGTPWTLTAMEPGDAPVDIVRSVPDGVHASILVEGDRPMIRIETGCNTGQASVTIDGTRMSIGPLALTRRGCPDDAARVERLMTTVLQGEVTIEIDAGSLRVSGPGGALHFEAA